ncbi:MAG TPA: ferrochelatase [Candidatus Limnocylindrales bacterium]|nr:ferrochelatase [Candidatus Limnocylindrales bacterium]
MSMMRSSGAEGAAAEHLAGEHLPSPAEGGRVAVLLCGYGEVEHNEDLAEYNALSLRLLVSKSVRLPDRAVPFLSRRLAKKARAEYERANRFVSPHNAIFQRQRDGIAAALEERYGDRVEVFTALNFCDGFLPEQVLPGIRAAGYDRLVIYPLLVVDSVYTGGLSLEQVNVALGDDGGWVRELRYLPSFHDRPEYQDRLARHIRDGVLPLRSRYASSQIGVVLLNHGCPYKAKGFETGMRDSRTLYHGVKERLWHEFPNISVGWMNHPTPGRWTQPDMLQAARNLVTLGARAIAFAPIGFVTDNHETILDVGYTVARLRHEHPSVEILQLPSLNDDPELMVLAADWIAPLIDDAAER